MVVQQAFKMKGLLKDSVLRSWTGWYWKQQ